MHRFFTLERSKRFATLFGFPLLAIASGLLIAILFFQGSVSALSSFRNLGERIGFVNQKFALKNDGSSLASLFGEEDVVTGPTKISLGNVRDGLYTPSAQGKVIRINLETMELHRYEDGILIDTFSVLAKGKEGSYWETPGGKYSVLLKEEAHLSSYGKVWMPWSMQFFGNYFIHGWPTDQRGKPLASTGYSGGCIRLSTDDAKTLYKWTDIGTTVSIFSTSTTEPVSVGEASPYFLRDGTLTPNVSAKAYIVGDIATGDIMLEKNMSAMYPIASVSKLMTALVALDVVHQRGMATISEKALATYGENGGLRVGEKIKNADLLYPLLMESSNDAAEVIAEQQGRVHFMRAMNEKVNSLELVSTQFEDPSGLSPNNYSSARDLFILARHIFEYKPYIYEVTRTSRYNTDTHTWLSTNRLLADNGYVGGKSGYTSQARETIVALFEIPLSEFDTRTVAVTLLQSEDRVGDTRELIRYIKENVYRGAPGPVYVEENQDGPSKHVTLAFGGDVMLDRGVESSVKKNFDGDFSSLFTPLTPLARSDISFINLEGPVSDIGNNVGSKYSFRMDPAVLPVMKNAGIDIVSFANNHVGDWNKEAFDDTLKRLNDASIHYTGAGNNKPDAEKPTIIEKNGLRIGFLGFSDVGPNWIAATEKSSGILLASDPDFETIIKNAKKEVDTLIVSVHWGDEYKEYNANQQALAYKAIESGATLVIGHHPHVIQSTEVYKDGLIAYSLGNLIFDQYFSEETMQGLILEVTIDDGKIASYEKKLVKLNDFFQPESITPFEE